MPVSDEVFLARVKANAFIHEEIPMAQVLTKADLKEFEKKGGFKEKKAGSFGAQKYPWDEWLDQKPRLLTRTTNLEAVKAGTEEPDGDFAYRNSAAFEAAVIYSASLRGQEVKTQVDGDDKLYIQAISPPDAAKGEEFRKAEKQKRKDREAKKAAAATNGSEGPVE